MWPSPIHESIEREIEDQTDLVYPFRSYLSRCPTAQNAEGVSEIIRYAIKSLVAYGVLSKITFDHKPLKVEHQLTLLGETLISVIESTAR